MKKITTKIVLGCCLMILSPPNGVNAQESRLDDYAKMEIKAIKNILKRQDICHNLLSRPCQNEEDYCFYPPCQRELSECHNIDYDDFVLMATYPEDGVAKSREWVQEQISEQSCTADHVFIVVDEMTNQVTITPADDETSGEGSYYSVALINSIIMSLPYVDSIIFHEGKYPDEVSVVPFRLYYEDGFETDNVYYNLSDTERGGDSQKRPGECNCKCRKW